jgi:thymidylate kinase
MITTINQWVMQGIEPQLTVYLMLDYATAQQRINGRKTNEVTKRETTPYDHEQAAFFRTVTRGYETLYQDKANVMRLDGKLTVETNAQAIYQSICSLLDSP